MIDTAYATYSLLESFRNDSIIYQTTGMVVYWLRLSIYEAAPRLIVAMRDMTELYNILFNKPFFE